jgi:hypothetical protein
MIPRAFIAPRGALQLFRNETFPAYPARPMTDATFARRNGRIGVIAVAVLCGALGLAAGMAIDRVWPTAATSSTGIEAPVDGDAAVVSNRPESHAVAESAPRGLGVSRAQLQAALASPTEPRFHYREAAVGGEPPTLTGHLGNGLAQLELIGPPENLTSVRLILPLVVRQAPVPLNTDQSPLAPAELVVPDAAYMVLLAHEVAPHWRGASAWIEEFLPQAVRGSTATSTQDNVRFTLARIERFGLVVMTAAVK